MDPALDILNRALLGDQGALSFLDRTSSVYVLDATDPSNPKTYGGWNFVHQALNEVERQETNPLINGRLVSHVQLLTTIAERVARRSPTADRNLVATCIGNASQYQGSDSDAQQLIALNAEIREIVMGRIAALAFDFSFHNRPASESAFANPVAIEKLCAVLAANAVSSGPNAIQHFLLEWIIPSIQTLPPFSVGCVTCHIAIESLRKGAPVGTKDMLQRLSHPVVGYAIAPVLAGAVMDSNGTGDHEWKSRVAAVSLLALERWCKSTDLSFPQIKHICAKSQINIVEVISDAMYSDSPLVIDSMAELLELCLASNDDKKVSKDRMTQARYIMAVDEDSFRSISPEDLYRIECKEVDAVLSELVSAIGLQRFRFAERQSLGDFELCRNLTRIAAAVGSSALTGLMSGQIQGGGAGLLDLLMKAAGHSSVNICGISLDVLSALVPLESGFPTRLLPVLQHRAIVPHIMSDAGVPSIVASAICGVDFHEFKNFRENTLTEALVSCYQQNPDYYMDSCTSAIEEFCTADATVAVSFQLEAALYCLNAIALAASSRFSADSTPEHRHDSQLERCSKALAKKPIFITANPLTLAQLNRFIRKLGAWFAGNYSEGVLDTAAELALATFSMAESAFSNEEPARAILREMSISPFSEAATALRVLLTKRPEHFIAPQALAALAGGWEVSYKASNQAGTLIIDDRVAFCTGMCHVFAAMPVEQRAKPYHAFALPTLHCMKTMLNMADGTDSSNTEHLGAVLARVSDEIILLSTMVTSFRQAPKDSPEQGGDDPSVALLREAWPSVAQAADAHGPDKKVSEALGQLLIRCVPASLETDDDIAMLKEICSLATTLVAKSNGKEDSLLVVYEVLNQVVAVHGETVEAATIAMLENENGSRSPSKGEEAGGCVENLLLSSIDKRKSALGPEWTRPKEQGQGQLPFESKNKPVPAQKPASTAALAGIFTLLETCARTCPVFLSHLPASQGMDRDDDRLLTRAVESAVASMKETEVEILRNSVLFLKSIIEVLGSSTASEGVKRLIESIVSPMRRSIVSISIAGACGGFHPNALDPAASLLYVTLRSCSLEEAQSFLEIGLQDSFNLGAVPKRHAAAFLEQCARGELSETSVMDLFEDLWELHQVEDVESIAESDLAASFAEKYRAEKTQATS